MCRDVEVDEFEAVGWSAALHGRGQAHFHVRRLMKTRDSIPGSAVAVPMLSPTFLTTPRLSRAWQWLGKSELKALFMPFLYIWKWKCLRLQLRDSQFTVHALHEDGIVIVLTTIS